MKNKVHVINPSELSYICNHCAYLKKNYDLENRGISVGVTQTLDSIEKKQITKVKKRERYNLYQD